jgi:hypothetical protein
MKEHSRIEIEGEGLGEVSDATLEKRASQIAHIEGREEVNDLDRSEALRNIGDPAGKDEAPEEQIAEGDRPEAGVAPASAGVQAERFELDDEANVTEDLVLEGVEEADFDTRVRSGDAGET